MRPLRHLPATVSDVQGPGRGDGLAARPDLPDAGRRRGTHRADRDLRPSPRPLSRLPSVRERVSLWRPLRLAPRGDTRPAPAPRSATPAAPPRALHLFGVPRARARRRSARAPAPLSAVGAPAAGAIDGRAARTRDVTEMLVDAELSLGRLELTVTYHDPCHLAHAQGIRREPRQLLRRIPGLRLVELAESDLCCGSAGVYSILEPEVARELMELKVARIAETGATVVATGNPGCLMQIAQGCRMRGLDVTVVHPVELLARAADAYPG